MALLLLLPPTCFLGYPPALCNRLEGIDVVRVDDDPLQWENGYAKLPAAKQRVQGACAVLLTLSWFSAIFLLCCCCWLPGMVVTAAAAAVCQLVSKLNESKVDVCRGEAGTSQAAAPRPED